MTWFRAGGGNGVPAALKSEMNDVLNKKFGTSTDYPPNDWPDTVDLMGPLEEKTVSGSIASFSDGADDVPIKSLVASLPASLTPYESIEVIHAGGNILETNAQSKTQNGITWTVNQDGSVTLEGTSTARTYLYVHGYHKIISKDATLTVSVEGLKDNGAYDVFVNLPYSEDGTLYKGTYGQLTYDHPSKTIQYTADKYIGFLIDCPANVTTNQTIKIMVSGGSSAMDFESYEAPTTYEIEIPNPNPNIRLTAEVDEGMWTTNGTINPSGGGGFGRAFTMAVSEKTTYDIYGLLDNLIVYLDSNKTMLSYEQLSNASLSLQDERKTTPANCAYIGLSALLFDVYSVSVKESFLLCGGSIDAISGESESTHANVKMSDLTWIKQTASDRDFFIAQVSNMKTGTPKNIASVLPYGGEITVAAMADKSLASWNNSLRIYDTDITTVSELLETYGNDGISYPLATAEPFSVEPIAVNSKAGSNNIWNGAGNSSVTYRSRGTVYQYPEGEGVEF